MGFVGLCVLLLGNGGHQEVAAADSAAQADPPILVIAVDGVEWNVVLPMLQAGKMPETAKLMQRGTYGLLRTFEPTMSPVIWTSIATGKSPAKHGIRHFARGRPGEPPELFSNRDRRTKAIWNIAGDHGKRVAVCGWWMTFPVEPVNGVMVAQTNTIRQLQIAKGKHVWKGRLIKGVPGQVYPLERQDEMMDILSEVEGSMSALVERIFGHFPHPSSALGKRLWSNCLWSFRADAAYLQITEALLAESEPYDFVAVYLGGPDVVGHRFWRYMQPDLYAHKPAPEQVANFGEIIEDYYAYVDWAIGRLVAGVGPKARVFVISDHGMHPTNLSKRFDPDDLPNDVNSAHHRDAPPGIIIAAGPGLARTRTTKPLAELRRSDLATPATVMDITPTLLALMDVPIGEDMEGRVADDLLAPQFLVDHPVARVPTHDTAAWVQAHQALDGDDPDQEERLKQLRSLGYIDDR